MKKSNLLRSKYGGDPSAFRGVDVENEGGHRDQPGVRKSLRMMRNGEAYGYVDPDQLANLAEPPPHVTAAMEDVLGDWAKDLDGNARIKCRVHPHMHRWALYEREYMPGIGEELWRCFYVFQTEPKSGYLPVDMDGDLYKAHYRGRIGDYVEPDRSHFELIEQFNLHKYGVDVVDERLGALEEKEYNEADANEEERTAAFLDDNWFLAWDEANQNAGSGQYMRSTHCMNFKYKSNLSRYRRVEKNGYTVIEKKTREEYNDEVMHEISAFTSSWHEARGLRRNWKPSDAELKEVFVKAGITSHEFSAQ